MSESKTAFEQFIKNSPNYNKLVFIHGERLFIFEDGQYKNLHVQLAWELWQAQQKRIDDAENYLHVALNSVDDETLCKSYLLSAVNALRGEA